MAYVEKIMKELETVGIVGRDMQWVNENSDLLHTFMTNDSFPEYIAGNIIPTIKEYSPVEAILCIANPKLLEKYIEIAYFFIHLGYLKGLYDGEERGKRDARLGEVFRP